MNSIYVTPQSDDILNNHGGLLNRFVDEGFHLSQSCERVLLRHEQAGDGLIQVDYTPGDGRGYFRTRLRGDFQNDLISRAT